MNRTEHNTKTPPRRTGRLCAALGAALACLALTALAPSAASAAQDHAFSTTFAAPGPGAGGLSLLPPDLLGPIREQAGSGLAVDDQTGDVYVADTGNHRIDEFEPDGTFIRAFGWEVDATTPEAKLQQCTTATGCQAGSSGNQPGQLEEPVFLAVDNSCALHKPFPLTGTECETFDPSAGDLYVADTGDELVTKFGPDGHLVETWGNNGPLAAPDGQLNGAPTKLFDGGFPNSPIAGIAVDPSGRLWVLDRYAQIFGFSQAGAFIENSLAGKRFGEILPAGLPVDSSGDFYAENTTAGISKFNSSRSLALNTVFLSRSATGLALDPATDDLYVDELGTSIAAISRQCEPSFAAFEEVIGLGCQPTQSFGAGHLSAAAGLALAPDGTLYVADTGAGQIAVFGVSLEADVQAPTEVNGRSALAHGTIDPEGTAVTTCSFQFGPSEVYGRSLPCLDEAGDPVGTAGHPLTGSSPVALHASLQGLAPGATAHYRLHALNAAGEEIHSEDETAETLVLARIEAEEAAGVTAEEATLKAEVDPRGLVTGCEVEWGTSTSYEHVEPCQPATIAAGSAAVPVSLHLTGLGPGTTYHWRVAATDANGTETSPDNTFVYLPGPPAAEVTQECANEALRQANGSEALPDCRAYEQVTPPHKNGALIEPSNTFAKPNIPVLATDGSRLIGTSIQCFAGSVSCNAIRQTVGADFEFLRTPAGWTTHPVGPPAGQFAGATLKLVNPDLGTELFALALPATPPLEGPELIYARAADGSPAPLGPLAPGGAGRYATIDTVDFTATADLSHVLFRVPPHVWPFDHSTTSAFDSIFEYAGPAAAPFLVDVGGGPGSTELIGECGAEIGSDGSLADPFALSADGRTAYFTVEACASGTGPHNEGVPVPAPTLYARIDGEGPEARTVEISAPAPEPACDSACQAEPAAPASFQGASTDGSRVYFTSTRRLTDEASEDGNGGDTSTGIGCAQTVGKGGCNLYLYRDPQEEPEPSGDHLIDVSAGDTSGQGPQVQGVMAVSPDGSRAYFVARGTLTGPNAEGRSPAEGADNLYVYDAAEAETRFVATLPGSEESETQHWSEGVGTANVTPDGDFLLFTSHAALTSDASREGPEQVYRYDARSEELTRVSIGRRGFDDDGNAGSGNAEIVKAENSSNAWSGPETANPSLSDDGSRVFFTSPLALVPGALDDVRNNSRGGHFAENVYEWEEDGVGSCGEAAGCVSLISDGKDTSQGNGGSFTAIELIGTDASGEDVFFTTVDPLVPTDTDTESDVYDARVGGGFALPPQAEPCQGDACKGQGTAATAETAPGTPNFDGPSEGPNNPQKPHKHHKRKHHKAKKHHGKRVANTNRRAGR